MTKDERELFDEKFRGLNASIIANNDLLKLRDERIFTKLDDIKQNISEINAKNSSIEYRVTNLEKEQLVHVSKCPQNSKFEEINKELEDIRVIKKYPKLFLAGLVIFIIIVALEVVSKFNIF